jgi:hypothetical protein
MNRDYLIGSGATISVFGAIAANEFVTWGAALATVGVALYSAYRSQRSQALHDARVSTALDTIYAANDKAIEAGEPIPFPGYVPAAPGATPGWLSRFRPGDIRDGQLVETDRPK